MHHCGRFAPRAVTRREMLTNCMSGFGAVALAALTGRRAFGLPGGAKLPATHYRARAKNVIFLYMDGGPSQVDTFDPKPRLTAESGKPFAMKMEPTQFDNNGATLGSPWKFSPNKKCGTPVSDLFPFVREVADELLVIRSMTSEFSEHTNANYFLHTGAGLAGRPSAGAWVSYGLGSECQNLPGFVVLNGGLIPPGGLECFGNGFLPATHQGSIVLPRSTGLANVAPREKTTEEQRRKLALLSEFDRDYSARAGRPDAVESAIANWELAFRMQAAVPDLMEIGGESDETKKLYGLEASHQGTRIFGRQCLLARRLVERGVRFIELTCPDGAGDRWDQHASLVKGHTFNAASVDQPIAGLLKDLRRRGLLDDTLVVWAGEFGRTPFAQGSDGRDHNPFGFTVWMAGGGVRAGTIHGATDEYGYKAVEGKVTIHDLHANILHALGIEHTQLTHLFGGRNMRLTDVHGAIIPEWFA